eukprot:COSAG05_NODE_1800_length_4061_cov_1.555780_6_plen_58_part_00
MQKRTPSILRGIENAVGGSVAGLGGSDAATPHSSSFSVLITLLFTWLDQVILLLLHY